ATASTAGKSSIHKARSARWTPRSITQPPPGRRARSRSTIRAAGVPTSPAPNRCWAGSRPRRCAAGLSGRSTGSGWSCAATRSTRRQGRRCGWPLSRRLSHRARGGGVYLKFCHFCRGENMSEAEHSSGGFTPLRWFRLGTRDDEEGAPPARERDPTVAEVAREGRRELLEEISSFLLSNDLAINPANLATAWKAFSGAAPSLRRRIETRVHAGEKVSQRWLDELAISAQEQRQKEDLQRTMDALDASVTRFARTTTEARSAITAYSSALGEHVQQLGEIGNEADVVQRLASLAEEMAERTRIAEAELKTSEREAKALRRRLDKARRE